MRAGITFSQTSVYVGILTSSYELQMFLMASRMVHPIKCVKTYKVGFQLTLP